VSFAVASAHGCSLEKSSPPATAEAQYSRPLEPMGRILFSYPPVESCNHVAQYAATMQLDRKSL
jgi:hypothetical protein